MVNSLKDGCRFFPTCSQCPFPDCIADNIPSLLTAAKRAEAREMKAEAVAAGYYHSPLYNKDYPKTQILTIEELFQEKKADMPPTRLEFFPKAPRISKKEGEQIKLEEV